MILSAGRRVGLVKLFQQEVKNYKNISIFTSDSSPFLSAACQISKNFLKVLPVKNKKYVSNLKNLCIKNNIKVIIPTIDTELTKLSTNIGIFRELDIKIIISDKIFIKNTIDKLKSLIFLKKIKLPVIKRYNNKNLTFPLVAKPRKGSSSKNIYILKNKDYLFKSLLSKKNIIFEKYINKNYSEYSADAYYNNNGILRSLVTRKRIEIRSGEVSKSITLKNDLYKIIVKKLFFIKGARGPINFQFFYNENNKKYFTIEINARFGGGFPLTYASGANYVKWIIDEYIFNKEIKFYDKWKNKLLMLRFDQEIFLK